MNPAGLRGQVVLLVVGTMCALAVGYAAASILLVTFGRTVPTELWTAASGAVGFVAGLLTNTKNDQPTEVITPPDTPLDVTPVGD